MAITKAKKQDILAKLEEVRDKSESIVFVHYKGLTVGNTTAMRRDLREKGVGYFVAKKTLMKKAFGETFRERCQISMEKLPLPTVKMLLLQLKISKSSPPSLKTI